MKPGDPGGGEDQQRLHEPDGREVGFEEVAELNANLEGGDDESR
jgi:hypothetical protein